jgi:hypothetical protein
MIEMLKKQSWQERALMVSAYQKEYSLSIRKLADELETSASKVHWELTLAEALSVYPELRTMKKLTQAIAFVRKKKFKRNIS